jgi:hypothetical protein
VGTGTARETRGVIIRVLFGKCCAFGLLLFGCFLPFKVNPGGELEFGVSYIDKPDSSGANNGWAITAQHKQQDFFGGVNAFALQYGRGPGTGLGCTGDVNLDRDNKSWRLVEYFDWQATPRLGGAVFNELRGLGQIDYANPLELMKPYKLEERELSWLTQEQIADLLNAIREGCDNPHVEPIALLCLATGARWSEAEGLTPSRLRNGAVTYSKTKSSKVRTVPIQPELEAFIRDHWKRHGQFTGAITSFRRALSRSGIVLPKGQASHALRHTFASHFMQKGGNILTLQKILGHSSLAMTMRYAHLAPEHLAEAVKLNSLSCLMLK